MNINYTLPNTDKIPAALRGTTLTGGTLCHADGGYRGEYDAVAFGYNGKRVVVAIKGRPELEAALAGYKAAEANKAAHLAAIGWPEYNAIRDICIAARDAYDSASEYGYPAREAAAMREAEAALDAAAVQYPAAAAYALATSYSNADNYRKAACGRAAVEAIESGADALESIEAMQHEWQAAAHDAVMRS